MRKKLKKILVVVLFLIVIGGIIGCGNSGNFTEGLTSGSNTFNYVLTNEAGKYLLHEVAKWKDSSDSDALGVTTKCCHNQFWTSYNAAVLYTNKPTYLPDYVTICNKN